MAALTITDTAVHTVQVTQQETLPAAVAIAAGQYIMIDVNGKWALGNSAVGGAGIGKRGALAAKTVAAGEALTGIIKGIMDLGNALSAVAYDAAVYVNDANGSLGDAAGTVSKVVGNVRPVWNNSGVPDKLLFIDL